MRRVTRRRFLGATGAAVAGAGIAAGAWQGLGSEASSAGRRNIVLIVIDSLRADHVGAYGNGTVKTPNIDALAAESLRLTRVFPEAMPTVPARKSILTGRRAYPFRGWQPWFGMAKRPGWEPIMPEERTLVTALRRAGYFTCCVTDNAFLGKSESFASFRSTANRFVAIPGQTGIAGREPPTPVAEALRWLPEPLHEDKFITRLRWYLANNGGGTDETEMAAARVFTAATEQLDQMPSGKPWLMVVDCFDPHEPWVMPDSYLDLYGDPAYSGPEIGTLRYTYSDYLPDAQVERVRSTYKAAVTHMDRWLGRFLDRLRRLELDDSTVIGLVSDHGILLGEHRWLGKGDFRLHPELIHVPMLLRDPEGRGAGSESDWFATTVDLAPSLMSMAGLEPPRRFEGADLSPLLDGAEPDVDRPYAHGGYGNYSFVVDDRWKLIARNDGAEHKLYDLGADPQELDDVSDAHPGRVNELWERIVREAGGRPPLYSREQFEAKPARLPLPGAA